MTIYALNTPAGQELVNEFLTRIMVDVSGSIDGIV